MRLSALTAGQMGSHRVVEVGAQHLTLDDLSGLARNWIPATAIHSVTWLRVDTATAPVQRHQ